MTTRTIRVCGVGMVTVAIFVAALFLADYVANNEAAQQLVERFGYFGILIISVISGLNLVTPVPAAAFVPIYTAAGFSIPTLIPLMAAGTLIADTIGYLIGLGGRHIAEREYPAVQEKLQTFAEKHRVLIVPMTFLYAALAPLPNEVLLIPLAIIGIRYRVLIIPLILGTLVYHTIFAYGAESIFGYFF